MSISQNQVNAISKTLLEIQAYINNKYYEIEDFSLCILLAMLSKTNMIALGQPGIAKSAVLREIVNFIDFDDVQGTPYFHIQMGADVSPNNIFGAPDIEYFKTHGIIKRHYKSFLPDAIIAFCSEFYRVSDQVANSGLLTILNEGEFKNGIDTVKTKLRFFMADTNFFPKQTDDLDVEESDLKLQALHDRFLARVYVKPLKDTQNKVKMILMNDDSHLDVKLKIRDLMAVQDLIDTVQMDEAIAQNMVAIADRLENKHNVFISPRRLKLSRNLIRAHAVFMGRNYCTCEDLVALQFSFWQKESDILLVKDLVYEMMDLPKTNALRYMTYMESIIEELDRNIDNQRDFQNFDIGVLYQQAIKDLMKLMDLVHTEYPNHERYSEIFDVFQSIENAYNRLMREKIALE